MPPPPPLAPQLPTDVASPEHRTKNASFEEQRYHQNDQDRQHDDHHDHQQQQWSSAERLEPLPMEVTPGPGEGFGAARD